MKTLYLSGTVGYEIRPSHIKEFLDHESKEAVKVIVNSPGGYVDDAFEIYNLFSRYKGHIEFIISGVAMSAMSYIIMAGDKISAFKNSIFMSHKVWGMIVGNSDEVKKESEIMDGMDKIIAESYVKRLGKSKEEILKDMKDEIWLLGWEALTEAGIIDEVIDKPEDISIDNDDVSIDDLESDIINLDKSEARAKLMQTFSKMQKDHDRNKSNFKKITNIVNKVESNKQEFVENKNQLL